MELSSRIRQFLDTSAMPVLFAGAGISARAGLPTWADLLTRMAEFVRSKDPHTANQMREYIAEGDLPHAAQYWFLSKRVVVGDKYAFLSETLGGGKIDLLTNLARLPFKNILTTNFDRCLHDAIASATGKSVMDFRHGEPSFKNAAWVQSVAITRIHGAIEAPETIILTADHLGRLLDDQIYIDLLTVHFTQSNMLFVGYSFLDPAIRSVLEAINTRYGTNRPGRHLALLPNNASGDFVAKLDRLNIEIVRYSPDDQHRELWDALSSAATTAAQTPAPSSAPVEPFGPAKRYLASCYARVSLRSEIVPLRQAIIEGLVSAIVQRASPASVSHDDIALAIHQDLAIPLETAKQLIRTALRSLATDGLCLVHDKRASWKSSAAPQKAESLESTLDKLVDAAANRALVEEGLRVLVDHRNGLKEFYRDLVLARGWDLGAAFASGRLPEYIEVKGLLYKHCPFLSTLDLERLERVCKRQIGKPTDSEAKYLSDLGRASFALELVMRSPRDSFIHGLMLPERIYFDANVLMPALTEGHPLHPIYGKTIGRLREATKASKEVELVAYSGFLNEIVSHRRIALAKYELLTKDFREEVLREALYAGTANMNVFVGGYANVTLKDPSLDFLSYLHKFAPYETEQDLIKWLHSAGIKVLAERHASSGSYAEISLELQKAYSSGLVRGKDPMLLTHDAAQLAKLDRDLENGRRSVFVTADRQLTDIVAQSSVKRLAEAMISNIGLAQLVDLLVGIGDAPRGTAQLLWGVKVSEKTEEVKNYLVAKALGAYESAIAMRMQGVVEQIADELVTEAERLGLEPDTEDLARRHEYFQLVGQFEDRFFEAMREDIEKTMSRHERR